LDSVHSIKFSSKEIGKLCMNFLSRVSIYYEEAIWAMK